jgi:hypothetical protein
MSMMHELLVGLEFLTAVAEKIIILGCFLVAACLAYSSTLKMETVCSPETLVNF